LKEAHQNLLSRPRRRLKALAIGDYQATVCDLPHIVGLKLRRAGTDGAKTLGFGCQERPEARNFCGGSSIVSLTETLRPTIDIELHQRRHEPHAEITQFPFANHHSELVPEETIVQLKIRVLIEAGARIGARVRFCFSSQKLRL